MNAVLDVATDTRLDRSQQEGWQAVDFAAQPSGCRDNRRWYVVASYPKAERRAHAALHLKGFEAYLPLISVRWRDRSWHTGPLWPGYLFLRLDLSRPWYPIRYAPGVFSLLTINGIPAPCSDAVISALRAGDALRAMPPPAAASWAPGMPCRPRKGHVFADHNAVVLAIHRETATLAVMFLGQLREISLHVDCLMACDDA